MDTEVDVNNPDGTLVGGMFAQVRLVLHNVNAALTVPLQAVSRNGDQASVLLVNGDGRLEERQVRLGAEGSDRVEVLAGLNDNDRVVIGSRSEFRPGEKVQPKPVQTASTPAGSDF
jgi:multidrug efflux pump subunit AcrA (membrane-fusion protein)